MRRRAVGASGFFVVVILLLVAAGILAVVGLSRSRLPGERGGKALAQFRELEAALVQFVAANGRLPCPANPTAGDGLASPATGATCSSPQGTIPWKTLGARKEDAIDPWGWQISYRVYTGNAGSLTQ